MITATNPDLVLLVLDKAVTLARVTPSDGWAVEIFHDYWHTLHTRVRRLSDDTVIGFAGSRFHHRTYETVMSKYMARKLWRASVELKRAAQLTIPLPPINGDGLPRVDWSAQRARMLKQNSSVVV